ncbi:MAG: histidine phosphatase family protein [Rhizobium sp.]|nr:histidine phosphatase family protein [Rhizobium sp.]
MLYRRDFLLTSLVAFNAGPVLAADPWQALANRTVFVLMRHAIAPGTGDPQGMRIGDCSTQRNLSAEGRAQARRIGALFREKGIGAAAIYSSEWCRCLDTARLLELGPVSPQPLLNSFFGKPEDGAGQTEALSAWLRKRRTDLPLLLVTHQVNITGLTSIVPSSGELVFVSMDAAGAISVIGRQSAGA